MSDLQNAITSLNTAIAGFSAAGTSKRDRQLTREENEKARQFSHNEAELSYQRSVEQWNRQNEYDSPQLQMARYARAGLNPNLIYDNLGSGSVATSQPQASTPSMQSPRPSVDATSGIVGALSQFQDLQARDLNNALAQQQILSVQAQTKYYESLSRRTDVETADKQFNFDRMTELFRNFGYTEQDARRMASDMELRLLGKEDESLYYDNAYKRDSLDARVFQEYMTLGIAFKQIDALDAEIKQIQSNTKLSDSQRELLAEKKHQLETANKAADFYWNIIDENAPVVSKTERARLYAELDRALGDSITASQKYALIHEWHRLTPEEQEKILSGSQPWIDEPSNPNYRLPYHQSEEEEFDYVGAGKDLLLLYLAARSGRSGGVAGKLSGKAAGRAASYRSYRSNRDYFNNVR